ncbi:MAG: hypothetical protein JWQ25_1251 [Daejeonella sp.]|nr:hypothetical protein [Daejeonella sp.]
MKWVLGIILAGIITVWPANLIMHHTGEVDMNHLTRFQYWIKFLLVPSTAFGLFLCLSCLFVPMHKKYAGMLVFFLVVVLIGLGSWQHYTDDGFLQNQYIIRYFGFIVGTAIGLVISHHLFKNSNWNSI